MTKPICPNCKSDQVVADAAVDWDETLQQWMVLFLYAEQFYCEDCEQETKDVEWVA